MFSTQTGTWRCHCCLPGNNHWSGTASHISLRVKVRFAQTFPERTGASAEKGHGALCWLFLRTHPKCFPELKAPSWQHSLLHTGTSVRLDSPAALGPAEPPRLLSPPCHPLQGWLPHQPVPPCRRQIPALWMGKGSQTGLAGSQNKALLRAFSLASSSISACSCRSEGMGLSLMTVQQGLYQQKQLFPQENERE